MGQHSGSKFTLLTPFCSSHDAIFRVSPEIYIAVSNINPELPLNLAMSDDTGDVLSTIILEVRLGFAWIALQKPGRIPKLWQVTFISRR